MVAPQPACKNADISNEIEDHPVGEHAPDKVEVIVKTKERDGCDYAKNEEGAWQKSRRVNNCSYQDRLGPEASNKQLARAIPNVVGWPHNK